MSAPRHGARGSGNNLLVLPVTLRLWRNYCEAVHLDSAWDVLWQIYWLLNIYPSRTSKPIYGFTHLHFRERKWCKLWGVKLHRDVTTPHPTLANFLNGIRFFPISGLFLTRVFLQCIGMWKIHEERKLTRLLYQLLLQAFLHYLFCKGKY